MAGTLPPGGGSSMPAGKQVKKVGSDASKINVPYFNQQQSNDPPSSTEHPLAVTTVEQSEETKRR